MRESHVELLQPEDWSSPDAYSGSAAPLFLMHDGGGTTFMYTFLSPLNRFLYGIRNPHFATGEVFTGGVPEMGRLYARWIRQTVAQKDFPARKSLNSAGGVDVILGGWSFGGLLSLEVAKQLEGNPDVRVLGIMMIDSIFPSKAATAVPTPPPGGTSERKEKSKNQALSESAMEEARRMVQKWTVPVWQSGSQRPPIVLLKAKNYLPSTPGGLQTVSPLDLDRASGGTLGWDEYDETMFEDVTTLDGHHFELFSGGRLDGTTEAMRQALDKLERVAPRS